MPPCGFGTGRSASFPGVDPIRLSPVPHASEHLGRARTGVNGPGFTRVYRESMPPAIAKRDAHPLGRTIRRRGQTLVEFSLALGVFLLVVMGILDLGRAVFLYNGVSESARRISRVTSVHPGAVLGASIQTQAAVAAERAVFPDLGSVTFACVDLAGSPRSGACTRDSRVRVTISTVWSPVTPILDLVQLTVDASSTVTVQ
jgi:Flp pilus assembly protein TadG